MNNKFKKVINRIFLFILAMPFGIPLLAPFFIIYGIYLYTFPEGREKLKNYFTNFVECLKLFQKSIRKNRFNNCFFCFFFFKINTLHEVIITNFQFNATLLIFLFIIDIWVKNFFPLFFWVFS